MKPVTASPNILRRIAVAAAALHRTNNFGRGVNAGQRVLTHLGYIQIDTISVVRRAHEHVIDARADGFNSGHWNQLVTQGKAFEYWGHAAAYVPMTDYRFSLPRMQRYANRHPWGLQVTQKMRQIVLDRIRGEGPLRARDFHDKARQQLGGWGRYKGSKIALEQLWHAGDLLVVRRDGFEKTYELRERALPAWVDTRLPTTEESARHLIDRARRVLGVFTAPHVTWLRKDPGLHRAVTAALDAYVEEGKLALLTPPARPTSPACWYADADALAAPPQPGRRPRLLSPFDPLVLHRDRGAHLFTFDYQLECYLPAARRRHGYFVLPLLHGTNFIARADCRAERARSLLEIRRILIEPGASTPALPELLNRAARDLATHLGCQRLVWQEVITQQASTAAPLRRALRALA